MMDALTYMLSLFGQVVTIFVTPDLNALRDPIDYKTCAAGIVRLLTRSDLLLQQGYLNDVWPKIFTALLAMLELPPTATDDGPDEFYTLDISEEGGYQTAYAKLSTAAPVRDNVAASLPPSHIYLVQQMVSMSPEKRSLIKSVMPAEANQFLPKYFENAGVPMTQL